MFLNIDLILEHTQMRDFLRVVSTNKSTYELKYYNIQVQHTEIHGLFPDSVADC
jgi:hypothetical protein